MIKLEHVVLASPEQMKFIIEGMRNPMNSWGKSDSEYVTAGYDIVGFDLGESDHSCSAYPILVQIIENL